MGDEDDRNIMQFLVALGANVNARNNKGFTPLHVAVLYRNYSVIDILIQAGTDINAKSCLKRTALHFAVSNYQPTKWKRNLPSDGDGPDMWMVRKLLNQDNIRVDIKDVRGDTPLMWAVMDKQYDTISKLLNKGANLNIRNKDSKTPLHIALSAQNPCPYILVLLLFHRPSLSIADKEGKTPIDLLVEKVINTQSYKIAYSCLPTIAFTHRKKITKIHEQKLESVHLSKYLHDCFDEVTLMKLDHIANGLTVFRFMLLGVDDIDFETPLIQVYILIVKRLLAGFYPIYLLDILNHIPKSNLSNILEYIIHDKDWEMKADLEGYSEALDADRCTDTLDSKSSTDTLDSKRSTDALDNESSTDALDNESFADALDNESFADALDTKSSAADTMNTKSSTKALHTEGSEEALDTKSSTEALDTKSSTEALYSEGSEETSDTNNSADKLDTKISTDALDTKISTDALDTKISTDGLDTEGCEKTLDIEGCGDILNIGSCDGTTYNEGCTDASGSESCEETLDSNPSENCRNIDSSEFFSKMDIFLLSKYLSRVDVFCLIAALRKGKIHPSMQLIRERQDY